MRSRSDEINELEHEISEELPRDTRPHKAKFIKGNQWARDHRPSSALRCLV